MLDVVVELDDSPREVPVPEDLATAMLRNRVAREAWDAMSFTHRKEYANAIAEAKKPETRARRVAKTIEALEQRPRAKR